MANPATEMTQIKMDEKHTSRIPKKLDDPPEPSLEDLPPVSEHTDGEINQLSAWSLLDDGSSDDLEEPDPRDTAVERRRAPKLAPKKAPDGPAQGVSSRRSQDSREMEDDIKDLKRDRAILNRENKEQAQELRDLKKKNVQLQEIIKERFESNDSHRSEGSKMREMREKFYEHVEMLEDHIAYFKQELSKRKHLIESMTIQTREANEEKDNAEVNVKRLQRQVRDLNENLTECKDDLLRLQPPSQVPDSEVSDLYATLAQHVSRWSDDATEEEDLVATRFEDLLKADEVPGLLGKYLNRDYLKLAKKYPDAQPHIIQLVVHRYIEDNLLNPELFVFGLDAQNITLLQEVEQGLGNLEPPRDSLTRSRWRSETLKALCAVPSFLEEQRRCSTACSKTLYAALAHLLPDSQAKDPDGWKILHEQVTKPAVKLANILRLSTVRYTLTNRSRTAATDKDRTVIHFQAVNRASLIDIATQKQLKPDSVIKIADDGRIGEEVLMVHPGLVREANGGGDGSSGAAGGEHEGGGGGSGRLTLCKPTVLIKLDEPMGRRNRGMKVLESITSGWFGGDGGGRSGAGVGGVSADGGSHGRG